MDDTDVKAVDRGQTTLDSCAAALDAAYAAFMLEHLPVSSLFALQGTCHALNDMIERAPSTILLAAFETAKLLPPAIADHLSSVPSWLAALRRHAAVIRRLLSGACTYIKQQPLGAGQVAHALSWSPFAQLHLAFAAGLPRETDLAPGQLHVLNATAFHPLPKAAGLQKCSAFSNCQRPFVCQVLPEVPQVIRLQWISDRLLLCKVWDGSGPAAAVVDTFSGVYLSRLDQVSSLQLAPDKRSVLVRHTSGQNAVYHLPALRLRYHVAPPPAATPPARGSMTASAAKWSMTGAHLAVCWTSTCPSQQARDFCLMAVHNAADGAILRTFDIHHHCGSYLPLLSWSPAMESLLLHGDGNCIVISPMSSHPELIGRYEQAGWSYCGRYIHGLQALDQLATDDSNLSESQIWDAMTHEQVFVWRQRKVYLHAGHQGIVWAQEAPVCYIPDRRMVVLMPTFNNLDRKTCRTVHLTASYDKIPLSESQPGDNVALSWSLSACGRLLVNSAQGQQTSQCQLPENPFRAEAKVTWPSSLRQGAIQGEALFSTITDVCGAPAERGPVNWPAGNRRTTMAWHPSPANSRMYAACNHAGDVCLVDGCAAIAVHVWYRDQLESADMAGRPSSVGPADLYWSPNGETLVVSRQGCMTFVHFGPAD